MDETPIESIAEKFVSWMDRKEEWWNGIIHDNAILDWFGRTIIGRNNIMTFLRIQFARVLHKIESVSRCAPLVHRALTKKVQGDLKLHGVLKMNVMLKKSFVMLKINALNCRILHTNST